MSTSFNVRATQSRPSWMRLFVVSSNNLYPKVRVEEDGLVITVLGTTLLPWEQIVSARESFTLVGYGAQVTCGGWTYILNFREDSERARLLGVIEARLTKV